MWYNINRDTDTDWKITILWESSSYLNFLMETLKLISSGFPVCTFPPSHKKTFSLQVPCWCNIHILTYSHHHLVCLLLASLHHSQTETYTSNNQFTTTRKQKKLLQFIIVIIIAIICITTYLTDKGEYTMLYKTNKNVYIKFKTSKVMIMQFYHIPCMPHLHTHIGV